MLIDPRFEKLADVIINYSTSLKPGEKILIEVTDVPNGMTASLIRKAAEVGGIPLVTIKSREIDRELLMVATEEQMKLIGEYEKYRMERVQAYVHIRAYPNANELADVPGDKMDLYEKYWWKPVHSETRVPKTKWVVLRWPQPAFAQAAEMSTAAFEDFYFKVCTLNYAELSKRMDALVELMDKTDIVQMKGPNTDITFSIKGIPAIKGDGTHNLPDGELFTAPVKDSVNGQIQYNTPTVYRGYTFENIFFKFKNGKIIEAKAQSDEATKKLNEILDSDEGARYIGEFSFGLNPYVLKPMKDILFDEKIAGSIHFTPGSAYEEADNGNRSQIHWDIVWIQRKEYGGGEVYFDGKLIRKDGLFVIKELEPLNPENLINA